MAKNTQQQKVSREAARDAFEYARAQMATGEGAGNRRKLIKASVDAKAERDPLYQTAFRKALQSQDMAEHASRARTERKRKDVLGSTHKNLNALHRAVNGPFAGPLSVGALVAIWQQAKVHGYDRKVIAFVNGLLKSGPRA